MTAETVFDELETLKKKAQKKNDRTEPRRRQGGAARRHHPDRERAAPRHPEARCRGGRGAPGDRRATACACSTSAASLRLCSPRADRDGSVQVQAGPMKMTVKENELRLVEEKKDGAQAEAAAASRRTAPGAQHPLERRERGGCARHERGGGAVRGGQLPVARDHGRTAVRHGHPRQGHRCAAHGGAAASAEEQARQERSAAASTARASRA